MSIDNSADIAQINPDEEKAKNAGKTLHNLITSYKDGKPFVLMIGGPMAAGKTELGKVVSEECVRDQKRETLETLDIDDAREFEQFIRAGGTRDTWQTEKWRIFRNRFKKALGEGKSVILSAAFAEPNTRKDFEALTEESGEPYQVQGIWLDLSRENSDKRLQERESHTDEWETIIERAHRLYNRMSETRSVEKLSDVWQRVPENNRNAFFQAAEIPTDSPSN